MCQYLKPNTLPRAKILTRAKFLKNKKKTLSENSSNSCVQTAATKPPGPKATSAATNTRPLICANQMALNSHLLLNWAPVHTTLRYSTATAYRNKLLATQQKKTGAGWQKYREAVTCSVINTVARGTAHCKRNEKDGREGSRGGEINAGRGERE